MSLNIYRKMLAARSLHPFQRVPWVNPRTSRVEPGVLGETVPLRWRVARDRWDELTAWVEEQDPYTVRSSTMEARLFGWPVAPDDSLPPGLIELVDDRSETT